MPRFLSWVICFASPDWRWWVPPASGSGSLRTHTWRTFFESGASHATRLPSGDRRGLARCGLPKITSRGMNGGDSAAAAENRRERRKRAAAEERWTAFTLLDLDFVDGLLHRLERLLEHRLLFRREIELMALFDALRADGHGDAHVIAAHAVLSLEERRARQDALLVLEIRLGHGDGAGGRRVACRAGLEQRDDLPAALARPVDDGLEAVLGEHLLERNPAHRAHARDGHHVVAVSAQHQRVHVRDGDVQLLGDEEPEARAVEHARHANHARLVEAGDLLHGVDHGVERVGDDDDERARTLLLHVGGYVAHDLDVDAEQVLAAHARLARHARGDDDHVGAGHFVVLVGADDARIVPVGGARLHEVERLALRDALHHVVEDDVAQLLLGHEQREVAADLTCADEGNLPARHGSSNAAAFGLRPDAGQAGVLPMLRLSPGPPPRRRPPAAVGAGWPAAPRR